MQAKITAIPANKLGTRERLLLAEPIKIFSNPNTEKVAGSKTLPWFSSVQCGGGSKEGFDESCGNPLNIEETSARAWAEAGTRAELLLESGKELFEMHLHSRKVRATLELAIRKTLNSSLFKKP